jgi:hypothetical protein
VAPDLETLIRAAWLDKTRARKIARASRGEDVFRLHAEGPWLRGAWRLTIPEVHGILAEDADWNAVTWAMDPAGLERLAETLEWLYPHLPGGFSFEALWGEEPIEQVVTRAELLHVVRAGRIGTRMRYHVLSAGERPT